MENFITVEANAILSSLSETSAPSVPNNTIVTEDGYVVKNAGKIERINTRIESRSEPYFASWSIYRMIRRDFNILSNKMFMMGKKREVRSEIDEFLMDLVAECELLKTETEALSIASDVEAKSLELRFICPQAVQLFKIFNEADVPFARLESAFKMNQISKIRQENTMEPFNTRYSALKSYLIGGIKKSSKTAAELGMESGIV